MFLCLGDRVRAPTAGILLRFARSDSNSTRDGAHATPARAGTELTYCALSLTAKLYLGWFILMNVVVVSPEEGGAEGALKDTSEAVR